MMTCSGFSEKKCNSQARAQTSSGFWQRFRALVVNSRRPQVQKQIPGIGCSSCIRGSSLPCGPGTSTSDSASSETVFGTGRDSGACGDTSPWGPGAYVSAPSGSAGSWSSPSCSGGLASLADTSTLGTPAGKSSCSPTARSTCRSLGCCRGLAYLAREFLHYIDCGLVLACQFHGKLVGHLVAFAVLDQLPFCAVIERHRRNNSITVPAGMKVVVVKGIRIALTTERHRRNSSISVPAGMKVVIVTGIRTALTTQRLPTLQNESICTQGFCAYPLDVNRCSGS